MPEDARAMPSLILGTGMQRASPASGKMRPRHGYQIARHGTPSGHGLPALHGPYRGSAYESAARFSVPSRYVGAAELRALIGTAHDITDLLSAQGIRDPQGEGQGRRPAAHAGYITEIDGCAHPAELLEGHPLRFVPLQGDGVRGYDQERSIHLHDGRVVPGTDGERTGPYDVESPFYQGPLIEVTGAHAHSMPLSLNKDVLS